jgi:hypothetical protein
MSDWCGCHAVFELSMKEGLIEKRFRCFLNVYDMNFSWKVFAVR